MKIAQVSPLYESCPPQLYGGTERIVSYLTEELVAQGHDVTLFASGDSRTSARLVPMCPQALRLDAYCQDPLAHHMVMLNRVAARAGEFDLIHFHTDYLHFASFGNSGLPILTTLHGRLDLSDLPIIYREFRSVPLVSISDHQRLPISWASWIGTVHHGLPSDLYRAGRGGGGYLAFLGRISPEKRPDLAIEIATRAGMRLRIAAKVDRVDTEYFETVVRPLLDNPLVEFIGEIGETQKQDFLGEATALLFPIDWPEPFGLVMIEAMAHGTPVIAFRRGAVPEVIDEGLTGWVVDDVEEAVSAVGRLQALDRRNIRRTFESRFTAARMAEDYVELYRRLAPRHANGMPPLPIVPESGIAVRTRSRELMPVGPPKLSI